MWIAPSCPRNQSKNPTDCECPDDERNQREKHGDKHSPTPTIPDSLQNAQNEDERRKQDRDGESTASQNCWPSCSHNQHCPHSDKDCNQTSPEQKNITGNTRLATGYALSPVIHA